MASVVISIFDKTMLFLYSIVAVVENHARNERGRTKSESSNRIYREVEELLYWRWKYITERKKNLVITVSLDLKVRKHSAAAE